MAIYEVDVTFTVNAGDPDLAVLEVSRAMDSLLATLSVLQPDLITDAYVGQVGEV